MDLILWRHADAHDGSPDIQRALTGKGRKQAADMAKWLRSRLPEDARILVSPATRALQTADALGLDYTVVADLAPGEDASLLVNAAGWPDASGTVVVVGHQPALGQATAMLLCGQIHALSMKKCGLIWLTNRVRADTPQTLIKVAMTPEFI